ncbi:MAG: DsbA family protein [Paracoccaceae bacterium]
MRLFPAALTLALTATTALAGGLGEMTDAERQAFRAEVRQYLLDNPDVLVEAMNELQSREDKAAANRDLQMLSDNKDAIYNSAADWVGGNPQGDITVVEFMDYRCGYCRKAFEETEELVKSDGNIRFVIKEFPILGEGSLVSSKFAIAVRMLHGDEAYKRAHDALITLKGDATPAAMTALAGDLGLDPATILAKMEAPEVMKVIEANHALASTMEINGTPTFVVDKTMVRGYVPLDGMRKIVDGERKG